MGCGRVGRVIDALLSAFALSLLVEWLQSYSPTRVSSMVDLICNVCGALIGSGMSSWWRRQVPRWVTKIIVAFHDRPRIAAIQAYALGLLVLSAVPFTFAIDVSRLRECVKASTLALFEPFRQHGERALAALAAGDSHLWHVEMMLGQRLFATWAVDVLAFVLLAWLVFPVLRRDYRFARTGATMLTLWISLLVALAMGVLGGLIVGSGFHATDLVLRLAGAGFGLATRWFYVRMVPTNGGHVAVEHLRRLAGIGMCLVVAFVAYTGVIPLGAEHTTDWRPSASFEVLPFASYFHARFTVMADDIAGKVTAYAAFSALAVASSRRLSELSSGQRMVRLIPAAAAIALVIEAAQLFVPARVPALSDLLLACGGAWLGIVLHEHGVRITRFAASARALPGDLVAAAGEMGILDELLATLSEPRGDAPREPSPRPSAPTAPQPPQS
jgi:VanZ family protein